MARVLAFLKRKSVRYALAAILTAGAGAAATGKLDVVALLANIASAFAPETTPLRAEPLR